MSETLPILSICIPTFNRADVLRRSLESITSDPFFQTSRLVEVVVSDNASSDHTDAVVDHFAQQYPWGIRYSRSSENVLDRNFERALRLGRGSFRKLQNDSFGVHTGLLESWVRILSSLQAEKPVVFMVNEVPQTNQQTLTSCQSLDEFLGLVSYKCTWIGGFGIWAEDLEALDDFSRASDLQLAQTDVVLRMVAAKKRALVICEFMQPCFMSGRKGGYNIAKVFGANYLGILREHVRQGALSEKAYGVEKKRVLLEHILPFIMNPDLDFEHDNLMVHLQDYHDEPYFVPALEATLRQGRVSPPPTQAPRVAESFPDMWRRANAHNETTCNYPIPLKKVSIGRRTHGAIHALHWGHPDERLRIGHFCSIGGGVEFLLGGNHAMDGFSTFPFKVKYLGHPQEALPKGPIVIGDDVWIGNRATLLSGSSVGQGAVIGACAVVAGTVPAYAVVAGNPARVVRYRFAPEVIKHLLRLDYSRITDEAIHALSKRLYEPLNEANVADFVDALMLNCP